MDDFLDDDSLDFEEELDFSLDDVTGVLLEEDDSFAENKEELELELLKSEDSSNQSCFVEVAVDTEYSEKEVITIQVAGRFTLHGSLVNFEFLIVNSIFKQKFDEFKNKDNLLIFFHDFSVEEEIPLLKYLSYVFDKHFNLFMVDKDGNKFLKVHILFFFYYSLKDIIFSFGYFNLKDILQAKKPFFKVNNKKSFISQRRAVMGKFSFEYYDNSLSTNLQATVVLKDLYGLDLNGLESLVNSCGFQEDFSQVKSSMDSFKENMVLALEKTHINDFVLYSMNDARILLKVFDTKIESFNNILKDVYNIKNPDAYFNKYNFPLTLGRLVFEIWTRYLTYVIFKNSVLYQLAWKKHSILNADSSNFQDAKEAFLLLKTMNSLDDLNKLKANDSKTFNFLQQRLLSSSAIQFNASSYCSIRYLMQNSLFNNSALLSVTSGGRTTNERPKECYLKYGADIDLLSAYGNRLVHFNYPLGRPRLYYKTSNDCENLKLGCFMNKYEGKMQKYKLFKVVVSGKLSFDQDLIHSKIISEKSFHSKIFNYTNLELGKQVVPTHFQLLRKEIIKGTITFSTWEILKKVCTNQEMKEISNLTVDVALYYLDKDCTLNFEDYLNHLLKDSGEYKFDKNCNSVQDTRSYKTFLVPLENFIKPLTDKRKIYKSQKDNPFAQAMQNAIKAVVNSYWGILTLVFFPVNNVLLSELVTNSIRNIVWQVSKPLNTALSITDGGPYSLENVNFLNEKGKKPGLNTLSSYYSLSEHPTIRQGPLNNQPWASYFEKNISPFDPEFANLNELAFNHVKSFWKRYNIPFDSPLEHKVDRTFRKLAFMNRAHYGMLVYSKKTNDYSETQFVIRGFKQDKSLKHWNPIYYFLKHILENYPDNEIPFIIQNNKIYEFKKLLKLSGWRQSLQLTSKGWVSSYGENVIPGDAIIGERDYRLYNLHCYLNDEKDYLARKRRALRKNNLGKKLSSYEEILMEKGVSACLVAMNTNKKLREHIKKQPNEGYDKNE